MTIDNAESGRGESGRRIETVRPIQRRRRFLMTGLTALAAAAVLGVPAYAMAMPSPSPTGGRGSVGITVEIAPSSSPSPSGSPSPTDSPSPSQTPTSTPPPGGGSGGNLPRTGLALVSFLAAGVLLVAVGVGLRVLGRRRAPVSG